jgi:phosphomannomutase
MQVNPAIFKTYDIRGIWGTDLNVGIAEAIGKAYATFLKPKKLCAAAMSATPDRSFRRL